MKSNGKQGPTFTTWTVAKQRFMTADLNMAEAKLFQASVKNMTGYPVMITFVRHGSTDANNAKVLQGWTPTDLSVEGREQANACGKWMRQNYRDVCAIISSDLPRAVTTAKILKQDLPAHVPIVLADTLRERNFGKFDGLSASGLATHAKDFAVYCKDPTKLKDAMEVYPDFVQRVRQAVGLVLKLATVIAAERKQQNRNHLQTIPHIVVVSHQETIRAIVDVMGQQPKYPLDAARLKDLCSLKAPDILLGVPRNTSLTRFMVQVQINGNQPDPVSVAQPLMLQYDYAPHLQK